jgi:hypothetical protein
MKYGLCNFDNFGAQLIKKMFMDGIEENFHNFGTC